MSNKALLPLFDLLAAVALVFTLAPTLFANDQDTGVSTVFVRMEINLEVLLKRWPGCDLRAPSHHIAFANNDK